MCVCVRVCVRVRVCVCVAQGKSYGTEGDEGASLSECVSGEGENITFI